MAQMGHTSSALALEVYAKKMERQRDTGERMDALIRAADWAQMGTNGSDGLASIQPRQQKAPSSGAFLMGGAGIEPATSCL